MILCLIVTLARSSRRVSNLALLLSSIHLLCASNSVTAFQSRRHTTQQRNSSPKQSRPTALFSNSFPEENGGRRQAPSSKLSAVAIGTDVDRRLQPVDYRGIQTVITTSLLITGNTIGASALVLPETAAKPGLAVSTGLFLAAYVVNLISGLVIAEVAIKQNEAFGKDVPSAFKDFAEDTLESKAAANIICGISLFVNTCVLAFDLSRGGQVASCISGNVIDSRILTFGFASALGALASTQSGECISGVASAVVATLFIAFAGLLLPGLGNVHDPIAVFLTSGTATDGIAQAAPIILMTMLYQNIVPSVTKILEYNRMNSVIAISLGSFFPLCMYLAWCFVALGGGLESSGGILLNIFSMTCVAGSSIGCIMSLSEEVGSFVDNAAGKDSEVFSIPAVGISMSVPLLIALSSGLDLTGALKVAGSYGSPLLYGAIPVVMAWTQRKKLKEQVDLVPGGIASLVVLGASMIGLVIHELSNDFAGVF